jgi:hypothetical protein
LPVIFGSARRVEDVSVCANQPGALATRNAD